MSFSLWVNLSSLLVIIPLLTYICILCSASSEFSYELSHYERLASYSCSYIVQHTALSVGLVLFRSTTYQIVCSRNFIWDLALSKLYANCLLSTLNARASLNDFTMNSSAQRIASVPARRVIHVSFYLESNSEFSCRLMASLGTQASVDLDPCGDNFDISNTAHIWAWYG